MANLIAAISSLDPSCIDIITDVSVDVVEYATRTGIVYLGIRGQVINQVVHQQRLLDLQRMYPRLTIDFLIMSHPTNNGEIEQTTD